MARSSDTRATAAAAMLHAGAQGGLEAAYAKATTIPGYQAICEQVPVLATWDDHDYGQNDAGGDSLYKEQAKALFLDFWGHPRRRSAARTRGHLPCSGLRAPGMRVQVILLDTRSFRSLLLPTDQHGAPGKERYLPDPDPRKTMLGAAQWAWLRSQLQQPAELRLIVSSIQVLAEGHGWERWGNLPRERERLLALIAATGPGGVIFLSGDRHVGGLYHRPGQPYGQYEITSSGLNMSYAAARSPDRSASGRSTGPPTSARSTSNWWAGRVTLSVRAANGKPVRRTSFAFELPGR